MTAEGMAVIRAKLDRAKFHTDVFAGAWNQFCRRGIYGFNMKMDVDLPHALHFYWNVRDLTPDEEKIFTDFGVIYGDILSNLRGTLDYLVWQLVLASGNQPTDRSSFPSVKRQADWPSVPGDRLRGVNPLWIGEIEKLQPYHEAQHPERHLLALLDHNNNVNKHRTLPPVVVTTPVFNFRYEHPGMPGREFNFERWLDRPIKDGTEFFRLTVNPPILNPDIGLTDPPIRLSFIDELDHSDGWDFAIDDLVQWVSDAVAIFEPAFLSVTIDLRVVSSRRWQTRHS